MGARKSLTFLPFWNQNRSIQDGDQCGWVVRSTDTIPWSGTKLQQSGIAGARIYSCTEWRRHLRKTSEPTWWSFLQHKKTMHRVGVPLDRTNHPVIVQFTKPNFRNKNWKVSWEFEILKEDLMHPDRIERNRLWPLVETARKQGKWAAFCGPNTCIKGKKRDLLNYCFQNVLSNKI